jgi:co-chaperonin GroES (HSP10)
MKLIENSTCPFKATFDNVALEKEVYSNTKLVLPDDVAATVQKKWRVVSAGPDCKVAKIGQYIIFNSATAGEIEWTNEKKYVILPEKDIVAVLK